MTRSAVIEALRKGAARGAAPKQQVIPESELPRYLAEGWVARMPVNGSKFVVELYKLKPLPGLSAPRIPYCLN